MMKHQRNQSLNPRGSRRVVKDNGLLLSRQAPRGMVRSDQIDRAISNPRPEGVARTTVTQRRIDLPEGAKTIYIVLCEE